jgi:hypothetical protein
MDNRPTVFVVQYDERKDFKPAEEFGELRMVFQYKVTPNMDAVIEYARKIMADYKPGDYILSVGNPVLLAVLVAAALEYVGEVKVLQWERHDLKYSCSTLKFYDETGESNND